VERVEGVLAVFFLKLYHGGEESDHHRSMRDRQPVISLCCAVSYAFLVWGKREEDKYLGGYHKDGKTLMDKWNLFAVIICT